jgi:hypothetical protein
VKVKKKYEFGFKKCTKDLGSKPTGTKLLPRIYKIKIVTDNKLFLNN